MATRPARPVAESVMLHARQQGVSISDYIATVLADHEGLSEHAPIRDSSAERLPLSG